MSIFPSTAFDTVKIFIPSNRGNILYVGGSGPRNYTKIQDAIDNASSGDTVYVYSGIYYEHINANKAIDLIGEDKETTIIDGEESGDVVHIFADWVNINSFTIQNSGGLDGDAGIDIRSNYCNIKDTNISNNQYGITLTSSDHNNISNNNISLNSLYGIYLDSGSNNNSISWNIISDNGYGFRLKGATINKIFGNRVMNNQRGIYTCCGSVKNMFYYNIFKKNNEFNAFDSLNNQWNYGSTGNYWDDYTGVDSDGDGIGDIPYDISGDSNQDLYPMMNLWGENPPVANFKYLVENRKVAFNASSSYDRDGIIVFYEWDFDDETAGAGLIVNHTYLEYGNYNVTLTINDDNGYWDNISKLIYCNEADNNPPNDPEITGPTSGKAGIEYTYSSSTTDPDGDQVYYWFDWDDDTNSEWVGPLISGATGSAKHTWTSQGNYQIKVKAKDTNGAESDLSDPLVVSMPRNRAITSPFLQFLENHPILYQLLLRFLRL